MTAEIPPMLDRRPGLTTLPYPHGKVRSPPLDEDEAPSGAGEEEAAPEEARRRAQGARGGEQHEEGRQEERGLIDQGDVNAQKASSAEVTQRTIPLEMCSETKSRRIFGSFV